MWPVLRPGAARRFGPERTKSGSPFGCGIGCGFEERHARRAMQEFLQLADKCEAALNLRAISHRLIGKVLSRGIALVPFTNAEQAHVPAEIAVPGTQTLKSTGFPVPLLAQATKRCGK